LSRPRVLLVDDNKAFLVHEADALSFEYEIVASVTSGAAALEAAARLNPDAVVLDISMPGMTGLDVAEELRKADSKAAIVFLTVHEDEEFVRAATAAGGLGYVVKSQLAIDLKRALEAALAGRPFRSRF
jgi:DNA-binding NarL/FixJ family response regulator